MKHYEYYNLCLWRKIIVHPVKHEKTPTENCQKGAAKTYYYIYVKYTTADLPYGGD